MMRNVQEGLRDYDERHQPKLFSWDTPAKIRHYIEVRQPAHCHPLSWTTDGLFTRRCH